MQLTQPGFPLQVAEEGGRTTVRFPAGTELSGANAEELARELFALVERTANPHLLVDLDGVPVLTSMILAKLISLNEKVRGAGGKLTLTNPTPVVRKVFEITRLDTILEVTDPLSA